METVYKLPLVLEPQPEGGYTITCPLLPNLITEADTLDEVIPNVADALEALIEGYEDLNLPLPFANSV
jgi:antitoxin HicB